MTKTTVQIPPDTLKKLRLYINNYDLTSHDQSKVIVQAMNEFFEKDKLEIELSHLIGKLTPEERETIKEIIKDLINKRRGTSC